MRKNILSRIIATADLDAELTPHIPIIEIAGTTRILIENHVSVIKYECNCICVEMQYGIVEFSGRKLLIVKISKEQLAIEGEICNIRFIKGEV